MSLVFWCVDAFDGRYACVVLACAVCFVCFLNDILPVGEVFDVVFDALVADLAVVAYAVLPCVT